MAKSFSPKGAVQYLKETYGFKTTEGTLAVWRSQGRGPRWCKQHGKCLYRQADLASFIDTSEVIDTVDSYAGRC